MPGAERAHPGPERALLRNELPTSLGGDSSVSPKEYLLAKSNHTKVDSLRTYRTPCEMNYHEDII